METREFTSEDLSILIKAFDYAYRIVEKEHDDYLTNPLHIIKLKLLVIDDIGLCAFTDIEAKIMRLVVQLYIFDLIKDNSFDEALKALSALDKLPE